VTTIFHLEQLLAQGHREAGQARKSGDPDAVNAAEFDEAVGQRRRDEDGEVGVNAYTPGRRPRPPAWGGVPT
jgi:hypothetical protein